MAYVDDRVSSIGIKVKVGTTEIEGAYQFGDLGADAAELDVTPLSATHAQKIPGLVDDPAWELNYYYSDTDFQTIETAKSGGTSVNLSVEFPNGTTFTNTGMVASNFVTGTSTNQGIQCKASFTLGGANGWTKSTT